MKNKSGFARFIKFLVRNLAPNIGSVLIMAAMLFVYNAQAAELQGPASPNVSPTTLSYQGTLFDSSGSPVTGSIGMTFRFYNATSSGTKLWEEVRTGTNAVPIKDGLFHVLLGGLTPIPTSVWSNTSVYLAILIEGESTELSPREMVGAVPYAMQASNVIVADGSITTAKIADGAVTQAKLDPDLHLSPEIFYTVGGGVDISTSSTLLNSKVITLAEQAPVLVTITARAIYTQVGDEFQFSVMRDGTHVLPGGNIHFQVSRASGHQYLTYTFVDSDVPAGAHTYEFRGVLTVGSGTRMAHEPTIILIPLP